MRIIFVGDVVGNSGTKMLEEYLPQLKRKYRPQLTIVNGENATRGRGINEIFYKRLMKAGADVITMGNHTWDNPEVQRFISDAKNLIRPLNFSKGKVPGKGWMIQRVNDKKIAVVNVQGRVFMNPSDDPFAEMEKLLDNICADYVFVDFHGETTSEKEAFSWYFDGRVSAVIGTHTHVQTNDARILPNGTAYLSDVGMTGPYDGILGMKRKNVIKRFLTQMPTRFEVDEDGRQTLGACVIDLDDRSNKAKQITPILINDDHPFFQ